MTRLDGGEVSVVAEGLTISIVRLKVRRAKHRFSPERRIRPPNSNHSVGGEC